MNSLFVFLILCGGTPLPPPLRGVTTCIPYRNDNNNYDNINNNNNNNNDDDDDGDEDDD